MLLVSDLPFDVLQTLLRRFGLDLELQEEDVEIRGSFWGDSEAGIIGRCVYVRPDTPVHSLLHETCHVICMSGDRRDGLDRDAGGDDLEETSVCYLQVLVADHIAGVGRQQIMQDMDEWGYSFRLGNTLEWFQNDAEEAPEFLKNHGLLDAFGEVTFRLRE